MSKSHLLLPKIEIRSDSQNTHQLEENKWDSGK